ncbi:hypothetical protein ACQKGO_35635 [Corallococcus interemptor]|uniref:hypothetical protein n=1 Tax=Corallococcus interemptor TaxID=2316720 RepID=UPI003D085563
MTLERNLHEAPPALRARLEAAGATRWAEVAGVLLAWFHGWWPWLALGDTFLEPPRSVAELNEALRASRAELEPEAVMQLVEFVTRARVTRTREDLDFLTLDQPGPEVIRSGTVGERGLAAWEAPRWDARSLTFYANVERADGADFVRFQVDLATRTVSVEVIDDGWFEIAARLE